MTPLIHYCSTKENIIVNVFCLDWRYSLFSNPNIQFLQSHTNCQIDYLWSINTRFSIDKGILFCIDKLRYSLLFTKKESKCKNKLNRIIYSRASNLINRIISLLYKGLPLHKVFDHDNPFAMVFDYLNAGAFRNRKLVTAAKKLNIPTFCLPHGTLIYSNKYITSARELRVDSSGLFFDHYIGGGLVTNYLLWRGIPEERIKEIGSLRFCKEWLGLRNKFIIKKNDEKKEIDNRRGTRVVIFLHQLVYNVSLIRLQDLLKALKDLKGIEVRVKPHTRGMRLEDIPKEVRNYDHVELVEHLSSDKLVDWCDVVVSFGSSIVIDALIKNKIFIYPDFVDTNSIFFKDKNACWVVDSCSSFVNALEKIKEDCDDLPYSLENQKKVLTKIIYGDCAHEDIREKYFQYIMNKSI